MTTLKELEDLLKESEIEGRRQDAVLAQFFNRLADVDSGSLLEFTADALPEVAPRKRVVTSTLHAAFIRG